MGFTLKKISQAGIAVANEKAELYRVLNQPHEAESICLDVLAVDPENQLALRNLALAITDQFVGKASDRYGDAERVLEKLSDPYERFYYSGIMHERRAKAQLQAGQMPHALLVIFEKALHFFAQAEAISPSSNDDAILHWNSCVRVLESRGDAAWRREHQESGALGADDMTRG